VQVSDDSATVFCILIPRVLTDHANDIMQHIAAHLTPDIPAIPYSRGGRVSSPELRYSQHLADDFAGLEKDTDRYDLLLLVKRAGKAAGFSSRMIQLLDYYMAFTRDTDWEEGARPIVYQSLAKTALDLGVSERQIQRLEQALFEAAALTWNDSGNHRRYGQRCRETGKILYAFGVDLTPLAYLKSELQAKLQEKGLYDQAWMETKRQISFHRRQICAVLAEGSEQGANPPAWLADAGRQYQELAVPIRTYIKLEELRSLLAGHKALYHQIIARLGNAGAAKIPSMIVKESSRDDTRVVHYNSTNQESFNKLKNCRPAAICFRESVPEPSSSRPQTMLIPKPEEGRETTAEETNPVLTTGLQHITLKQALNAASERFRAHIPMQPRPMNWTDIIEAAYRLKPELHISQKNWGEACISLGRVGAAICLLLTDQAMQREADPVRKPGAYFRAMINRATTGELYLHSSVFGILKREEGME
jgi:replication initiation protein RepC